MPSKRYEADIKLKEYIETCSRLNHRILLFIYSDNTEQNDDFIQEIGEKIMVIHYLISKCSSKRPSLLWTHKADSVTPKLSGKVLKRLEKKIKSGTCNIAAENPLHLFFLSTNAKFCSFDETHSVLGNTFNLCIIQDFKGLTPNVLCRVSETVSGGGALIFLLSGLDKLENLYGLTMDVHRKLKTLSHPNINPLFNERLALSLASCKTCLILDSNLKLRQELAFQKSIKNLTSINVDEEENKQALEELMGSLSDAEKPLPQLCRLCTTMDQAKAILKMVDVLMDKNGHSTISLTAARGRGKSSALGLGVAAAIYLGVNNIFIVSPHPENLSSFFEFLFKGFDSLDYKEGSHYDIIQSTNPEFKDAVVRVNIFARHRQNIQYVSPNDFRKVSQAELVVIDEAAAIPLVHVKALIGPHNVFMASTINGYEGTGRSLSLKLLQQLRQQSVPVGTNAAVTNQEAAQHQNCRPLFEISLEKSIRYNSNDPVENWLNDLLCLDATSYSHVVANCPSPDACNLYYVNRNVLFSGHKETESFLHQVMSLLVASHYRNSPDDLQMLCDAPAHHLFVLVPQLPSSGRSSLPSVFCVIQVCEEGGIPSKDAKARLNRGERPNGDLIPWTIASQFFNHKLTKLKGLRIIRIATHSDYQSMGYGSRAIRLLIDYYEKKLFSLDDKPSEQAINVKSDCAEKNGLMSPRQIDQPLLMNLSERTPEDIDYVGVSYGITDSLCKFWKKSQFLPVYISLSTNKITAEHNCIMLHPLFVESDTNGCLVSVPEWMKELNKEFMLRFTGLLGSQFSSLHPNLVVKLITTHSTLNEEAEIGWSALQSLINGHDLQRIESYAKNLSDRHLITDLLPALSSLYFNRHLPSVQLSNIQASLLIGCGYQYQQIETVANQIDLPIESALGQFNRAIRRLLNAMTDIQERTVSQSLPESVLKGIETFKPISISLDQELEETAQEYEGQNFPSLNSKLSKEDLSQYIVKGDLKVWDDALSAANGNTTVSIKSNKRPARMTEEEFQKELEGPGNKSDMKSGNKRKKLNNKADHSRNKFNKKNLYSKTKDKRKRK